MELQQVTDDPAFSPFWSDDFNARDFVRAAVAQSTSVLQRLQGALQTVDQALRNLVTTHQPDLVARATQIDSAEKRLRLVSAKVALLHESVNKLKQELLPPYHAVQTHARQLAHTQAACETLRSMLRVVQLHEKLKTQMTGTRDLTKAAQTFCELDKVLKETATHAVVHPNSVLSRYDSCVGLDGCALIDVRKPQIVAAGAAIRSEGATALWRALETSTSTNATQAIAELGNTLQIFANLGELPQTVTAALNRIEKTVALSAHKMLDSTSLMSEAAGLSTGGASSTTARTQLWTRLEALTDFLYHQVMQTWHLQRVLLKKKDAVTNAPLIDQLAPTDSQELVSPMTQLWRRLVPLLETELDNAAKGSSFVKNIFVSEFPRLFALFDQLCERIGASINSSTTHTLSAQLAAGISFPADRDLMLSILASHQSAFVAKTMSRLHEPIALMFNVRKVAGAAPTVPSVNDLNSFIVAMHSAMDTIRDCPTLVQPTLKAIAQSIQMLVNQCESLGEYQSNVDAFSFRNKPKTPNAQSTLSTAQQRNIDVFRLLAHIERSMIQLCSTPHHWPSVPDAQQTVIAALVAPRQALLSAASALVAPMFASFSSFVELLMSNAPKELQSDSIDQSDSKSSAFVRDVIHAIDAFFADRVCVYSQYNPSAAGNAQKAQGGDKLLQSMYAKLTGSSSANQAPGADLVALAALELLRPHLLQCSKHVFATFVRCAALVAPITSVFSSRLELDAKSLIGSVESTLLSGAGGSMERRVENSNCAQEITAFRSILSASVSDIRTMLTADTLNPITHSTIGCLLLGRLSVSTKLEMPHVKAGLSVDVFVRQSIESESKCVDWVRQSLQSIAKDDTHSNDATTMMECLHLACKQ